MYNLQDKKFQYADGGVPGQSCHTFHFLALKLRHYNLLALKLMGYKPRTVFYETGGVWAPRNQEGQNENRKNYTKSSSHKSIRGWNFAFAHRLTRANSFLKTALHHWTERGMLKITSLRMVQIAQHIVMIISIKKGKLSWSLKLSMMSRGSLLLDTIRFRLNQ